MGDRYENETSEPQFVPQPPNRITAFDTYGPHEWPKITPVNTDLALVWKVLIILATFPWWVGVTWLVRVGW